MKISDYVQLVALLSSAITQVLILVKRYRKAVEGGANVSLRPLKSKRDLLDLSFVLLFASLISFLLIQSLLISGRIVSLELPLIVEASGIALLVCGLLVFAYLLGRAVLGIGIFAATTLLVLFAGPGGSFRELPQGAEQAPDLLWPILLLLAIASASAFHSFGRPLSAAKPMPERVAAAGAVAVMALAAAVALGVQSASRLDEDRSIPKLGDDGRTALAAIRNPAVTGASRKAIYELLSDYALATKYEELYEQVSKEYEDLRNQPSLVVPSTGLDEATATKFSAYRDTLRRRDIVSGIYASFGKLGTGEEAEFLRRRLAYIHPLGQLDDKRAPISVPGRTSAERLDNTADYRQVYAISKYEPALVTEGTSGLQYDSEVLNQFRVAGPSNAPKAPVKLRSYWPLLFPNTRESGVLSGVLEKQLVLPSKEEAYLAYSEYRDLAKEYVSAHLPGALDSGVRGQLSSDLIALPADVKDTYLFYEDVAKQEGSDESDLLAMLRELATLDFTPVRESKDVFAIDKLIAPEVPDDPGLATLRDALAAKSAKSKDLLEALVKRRDLKHAITRLFDPRLTGIIQRTSDPKYGSISLAAFVANPVTLGLQELLERWDGGEHIRDAVRSGWKLDANQRESLLFFLSTNLYESGGPYMPGMIPMLIVEVGLIGRDAQVLVASLLYLPIVMVCIIGGDYVARKLSAREMLYKMIKSETEEAAKLSVATARAVDLVGRETVLDGLLKLARRGWATIALAGRRGVGKSRILQKLQDEYRGDGSIAVWMFAPSLFAEEDFVEDIFERLAMATEAAIGKAVGAKPLIVRGLEQRSTQLGVWMFLAILGGYALLVMSMSARLLRPELMISWIPAGLLILLSACVLTVHLRKMQPADLTFWIEREQTADSQLVWLYRETAEALRFLARRRSSAQPSVQLWRDRPSPWTAFLLGGVSFCSFAISAVFFFSDDYNPDNDLPAVLSYLVIGVVFLLFLLISFGRKTFQARGSDIGLSLGLLVEKYRQYAGTVARRVKHGALGRPGELAPVVVCIDELDKIVEFNELRKFVRIVKSVFEIPGVSYYLSISEDALVALNLGASLGKNEVDSSFDHIVMVPAMSLDAGEMMATRYAQFLGLRTLTPRIGRAIAAMSFGIPRDIIRRCDELADALGETTPGEAIQRWISMQVDMGQASGFLSGMAAIEIRRPFSARLDLVRQQIESSNGADSPGLRYLLLLGVLVVLFEAASAPDEIWLDVSGRVHSFGYGLPNKAIEELRAELLSLLDLPIKFASVPATAMR